MFRVRIPPTLLMVFAASCCLAEDDVGGTSELLASDIIEDVSEADVIDHALGLRNLADATGEVEGPFSPVGWFGYSVTGSSEPNNVRYSSGVFQGESNPDPQFHPTSFELSKQFVWGNADVGQPIWRGVRFEGYVQDWAFAVGDEVSGNRPLTWGGRDVKKPTMSAAYLLTGLRVIQFDRFYEFEGIGGILDYVHAKNENDHLVVGPQLGIGWVAEKSIWRFEALALGLAGYGRLVASESQTSSEALASSALNRNATLFGTHSYQEDTEEHFGWNGELRLRTRCQVTKRWRIEAAFRWLATGPVYEVDQGINWNIPNWGSQPSIGDDDTLTESTLYVGVAYTR